jgi:transcriptional regulator with XRE-family HTH domain
MTSLPDELVAARTRLGLTQEQAAQRVGISLRSYQGYERGENEPRDNRAREMRKALGIVEGSPGWLTAEAAAKYYAPPEEPPPGPSALVITVRVGDRTSTHELRWHHGPPLAVDIGATTESEAPALLPAAPARGKQRG